MTVDPNVAQMIDECDRRCHCPVVITGLGNLLWSTSCHWCVEANMLEGMTEQEARRHHRRLAERGTPTAADRERCMEW